MTLPVARETTETRRKSRNSNQGRSWPFHQGSRSGSTLDDDSVGAPPPAGAFKSQTSLASRLTTKLSFSRSDTFNSAAEPQVRDDIYSKPSTRLEHLAYFLDRILAKRRGFFLILALWGLLQVSVWGMIYSNFWQFEGNPDDPECGDPRSESKVHALQEGLWEAWTFMADPGTHAKVYMRGQRIVGGMIAISGILFWSTVMAVTVDAIREKMDRLRQGRSKIVENGHTLILGWTEKSVHIIEELCNANESEGGGVIAVLGSEPKEKMESELALQLPTRLRRGTRVIFRSGSPLVLGDLYKVSVDQARSIIILAHTGDADHSDTLTLRTLLAVRTVRSAKDGHIVAEVRDIDNEPLVKLVGGAMVETVVSHDVIGRLMLMSVRQPGLTKVFEALLGFEGDEFYMSQWPELVGHKFGELAERFPNAIPIGICSPDRSIQLGPRPDRVLVEGDEVIVIAEDNDTYKPEEPLDVDLGELPPQIPLNTEKEKILLCGWRRDIRDVLQQLDRLTTSGSEVHMMTHSVTLQARNARLWEDGLDVRELRNMKIVHHFGNTSVRRKLENLPIEGFTSCMILADQEFEADTMHSDSHSLATLLLFRDIQAHRKRARLRASDKPPQQEAERTMADLRSEACPTICEVLDPHTQKTISRSQHLSLASDFCQTNKLVAQVLSMVSEDRYVKVIIEELLGSISEIAVVPAAKYTHHGEKLSFMSVAKRAMRYGEVLIGYQASGSTDKTTLNPLDKETFYVWDSCDFAIIKGNGKARKSMPKIEDVLATVVDRHSALIRSEDADTSDMLVASNEAAVTVGESRATSSRPLSAARANPQGDDGLSTEDSFLGSGNTESLDAADRADKVSEALQRCMKFMPRAREEGFEAVCSKLPPSDLRQLAQALKLIRAAVVEQPNPRPDTRGHLPPIEGETEADGPQPEPDE